jgi:hypothetical protein
MFIPKRGFRINEAARLSNVAGNLLVEISHPSLKAGVKWFLPMLPEGSPVLQRIDRSTLVSVRLHGNSYLIPYLHVRTTGVAKSQLKEIDQLEREDSINILNHVQDLLAWD